MGVGRKRRMSLLEANVLYALGSLMTAEEFGKRPDPGYPEELVQGRIVAMPLTRTQPRLSKRGRASANCVRCKDRSPRALTSADTDAIFAARFLRDWTLCDAALESYATAAAIVVGSVSTVSAPGWK